MQTRLGANVYIDQCLSVAQAEGTPSQSVVLPKVVSRKVTSWPLTPKTGTGSLRLRCAEKHRMRVLSHRNTSMDVWGIPYI